MRRILIGEDFLQCHLGFLPGGRIRRIVMMGEDLLNTGFSGGIAGRIRRIVMGEDLRQYHMRCPSNGQDSLDCDGKRPSTMPYEVPLEPGGFGGL
jgi:hypothetical protein